MIRAAVLTLALALPAAFAQQAPITFEVASIKPSAPSPMGEHRVSIGIAPGGRFTAQGVSPRMLISIGFGVKEHEIVGGPSWLDTERYDISAKPDAGALSGPLTQEQMKPMIQALLAERFKLATHPESKEATIYVLVAGKNGLKAPESQASGPAARSMRMGNGSMNATGVTVQFLADSLSRILNRTVVDKTGLKGLYDFKLEWTPDDSTSLRVPGLPALGGDAPPPTDAKGPSLFNALEEQLGLRLNSEKGQITTIVIDHIEKPSAN